MDSIWRNLLLKLEPIKLEIGKITCQKGEMFILFAPVFA
ncbi:hypothetical protein AC062_0488 [Pasteurellaceae bacterium NI1060]|nr:hypothetical protein AC062_0488 [Pasteurellaceae bacterium NI1060]